MADDDCITQKKKCSTCGVEKPATTEYFHHRKKDLFGLHYSCKECRKSESKLYAEKTKDIRKEKYHASRDMQLVKMRLYREANRELMRAASRAWYMANREQRKAYERQRSTKDPRFRLRRNMSCQVWGSLRGKKQGRSLLKILDYSVEELKAHLERQFLPGMTWDNYGQWHVDHIIPVASFAFDSPDDASFKACWSLSNLRPLWAKDNRKKHAKIICLL